jgi:hypothetical protein
VIQKIDYLGLPDCYPLSNAEIELVVTTNVGPRVLRYAFAGAENIFGEVPELKTSTEWGDWKPWGGHRLWVAPEEMARSYAPDNTAIAYEVLGEYGIALRQPKDPAGFVKEITLELTRNGSGVTVDHRIVNETGAPVCIAPWAITIMRGGGVTIIPQEPFRSHDEYLLPARSLVLWYFTDLTDPRIVLGRRYIQLRTDASRPEPQKIGAANQQGWSIYYHAASETVFAKRVAYKGEARYTDFGANTETYSAGDYMELETLGPIELLEPGGAVLHREQWHLFRKVKLGTDENEIEAGLVPILPQLTSGQ